MNSDLRVTWQAPNERGSPITTYNVYVKDKSGSNVEYTDCASTSTICSIALTDLLQNYLLLEADDIEVQVTATNFFGTSDLSVVDSTQVKQVQTVPHKPSNAPARGGLTA